MNESDPDQLEPLSAGELQRRAISGSTWTAAMSAVSLPIAFVGNAVVARSLGVSSYGDLAFLSATLAIAYAVANLGFSNALTQQGSSAEASGRRRDADELLRRTLGFHTAVELPALVVVALVLTRNDPWWEAVALSAAVALTCVFSSATLSITIENRTAAAARLAFVVGVAMQAASVTTALVTHSAPAVWVVRTLVPAAALVLNLLLLDPARRRTVLEPRFPRSLGRIFWRYALFSWASGLLALLVFSRSEIFILQAFHKTHALGLFALAFGLSQVITAPADAMLHALLPAIAGILSAWPERARAAFERSTRVSALVCGAVAAVVVPTLVFAIPMIYGHSFITSAWLFVPLALVSCLQSVNNPVQAFVNGRQRGDLILKANVVALFADLVLAVALIPRFGAWGAVVANVVGQLVALAVLALTEPFAVDRGITGLLRLNRPFFFGTAVCGAALAVGAVLRSSAPTATAAAFAIGCGLYVLAVRTTRTGLTSEDRDAVVGAMGARTRPILSRLLAPITTPLAA